MHRPSAEWHGVTGTGEAERLLFTVYLSSLFEFGTMFMYYSAKAFFNLKYKPMNIPNQRKVPKSGLVKQLQCAGSLFISAA